MKRFTFSIIAVVSLNIIFLASPAYGQCGIPGTPPCKKTSTKKTTTKKTQPKTATKTKSNAAVVDPNLCLSPDIPQLMTLCPDLITPKYLPAENDNGYDIAIVKYNKSLLREAPQFGVARPNKCYSYGTIEIPCEGDFLEKSDNLVILERNPTNDWFNVINLENGEEGWVWKGHVNIYYTQTFRAKAPEFEQRRSASDRNPDITITNNTDRTLSMRLGAQRYTVGPYQSKTITVYEGSYKYYVAAPRTYPLMGEHYFSKGSYYTWSFRLK